MGENAGADDPAKTHELFLKNRARALAEERQRIMALGPEDMLREILEYQSPAELVQSFGEGDFYILLHEIGVDDALPVLAEASFSQWEHILDMEVWEKDQLDTTSMTLWISRFLSAAPERFMYFIYRERKPEIYQYLYHTADITYLEHDQDPGTLDNDFETKDDVFYYKTLPAGDPEMEKVHKEVADGFLDILSDYDIEFFRNILTEAKGMLPAENEEDAFRQRNVRLAEKGFLPFDEAATLFSPLSPEAVKQKPVKKNHVWHDEFAPASLYPVQMLKEADLFARILMEIQDEQILSRLQTELAAVCNKMISAEDWKIKERTPLQYVVKRATGGIIIGLDLLVEKGGQNDVKKYAELVSRYPLEYIFRAGYGAILSLRKQALEFVEKSWFKQAGLPLSFWDETWVGVLGGVLIKKPKYFDNYSTGVLYRDFLCTKEVNQTQAVIRRIKLADQVFSRLDAGLQSRGNDAISKTLAHAPEGLFFTWKNVLLTMWAREGAGLPHGLSAISLSRFRPFYRKLWAQSGRKIKDEMRTSFLGWIHSNTGTTAQNAEKKVHENDPELSGIFESLFQELESEYGGISAQNLDPRHIHLFLLQFDNPDKTD